jgi:hypothetical protein
VTTFDNLAPHPSPGQDGAALSMAKNYAVLAQANFVRSLDGPTPDVRDQGALSFQYLYTIVFLLAGLIEEVGEGRADTVVSNLLLDLEAPHVMGPDLHAWLIEVGIDPAQVDQITRALPEMQRPTAEPEPTGPRPGHQVRDGDGELWTYVDAGGHLLLAYTEGLQGQGAVTLWPESRVVREHGPLTPVEGAPLPAEEAR